MFRSLSAGGTGARSGSASASDTGIQPTHRLYLDRPHQRLEHHNKWRTASGSQQAGKSCPSFKGTADDMNS